jgi:hypothetical protein
MPNPGQSIFRLCLKPAKLMNSHIFPEFVFRPLYDTMHRFRSARIDEAEWEWEQKGYREPMLCANCEQQFSRYEKYACETFFKKSLPAPISRGRSKVFELGRLDYKLMKLFLLSLLWRAGTTKHDYCKHVELGKHTEQLRQMLFAESPGRPEEYACFVCTVKLDGVVFNFFIEPTPCRVSGHKAYRFVFGGFLFFFFVSSHQLPPAFRSCALQADGNFRILDSELADHPFLRDVFNRAKDAFGSKEWN